MIFRHRLRWAIATLAIVLPGCAEQLELGKVSGTVTLAGRPLAGVQVIFLPDPAVHRGLPRSTGITDEEGRFELLCDDGRPGAAPATHLVMIVDLALDAPVVVRGSDAEDLPRPRSRARVPAVYQSSKTPLREIIELGEQTIELKL
jgi:hypothetical protein